MNFIDSHAHLDDTRYNGDRDSILFKARENNVTTIVAVCCITKKGDAEKTVELMNQEGIYGAFGVHPHDSSFYNEELENYITELMNHPKAIAIGEIGLDYYYKHSLPEAQRHAFSRQIALAGNMHKPIIIHSRDSQSDTMSILKTELLSINLEIKGIMHCFSGNYEMAMESIALGLLISFSGVITFENAKTTLEIVKKLPIEQILSETDAPYLTPVPYRGKRNEPAYVVKVVNKIAELKNISVKNTAEAISANFSRLIKQ
jgi:TatD DNase family protein